MNVSTNYLFIQFCSLRVFFCYSMCDLKHHWKGLGLHSILLDTEIFPEPDSQLVRYSKAVSQLKKINKKQGVSFVLTRLRMQHQPRWGERVNIFSCSATPFISVIFTRVNYQIYTIWVSILNSWERFFYTLIHPLHSNKKVLSQKCCSNRYYQSQCDFWIS